MEKRRRYTKRCGMNSSAAASRKCHTAETHINTKETYICIKRDVDTRV